MLYSLQILGLALFVAGTWKGSSRLFYSGVGFSVALSFCVSVFALDVAQVVDHLPADHSARIALSQQQKRHDLAQVRAWQDFWKQEATADELLIIRTASKAIPEDSQLGRVLKITLQSGYISSKQAEELKRRIRAELPAVELVKKPE